MIDMCFLLITFFIMVIETSKAEVIEVFLPVASNAVPDEDPPENRVIMNVDRHGVVWIGAEKFGRPTEIPNRDKLIALMRSRAEAEGFENKVGNPSKLTVYIRADAHATYRYVQAIMLILTDPKVRVIKVHYVAKNPRAKEAAEALGIPTKQG